MHRFILAVGIATFGLVQAAFAAPPVIPTWTGFYLGGHGAYGWGTSHWIDDPIFGATDLLSHNMSGAVGGAQFGYNWQTGSWVFGAEAAASFGNIKGGHVDPLLSDLQTDVTSVGTLAARIGFAFDHALLYVKGGGGWETVDYDDYFAPGGPLNGTNSSTRWGWLIGGGFEYMFMPQWTIFVEYEFIDFGSDVLSFNGGVGGAYVQTITDRVNLLKVGVNFLFGGP